MFDALREYDLTLDEVFMVELGTEKQKRKPHPWNQESMEEFSSLLRAARKLDANALAAIFDIYSPALYKFISRFERDPVQADGIVADVFVQLMADLGAGQGPRTNIRLYLYRIAHHLVLECLRDSHPHAPLEVAIAPSEKDEPASMRSQSEERVIVEALLSTMNTELSEDQRLVIILRFLEDFSLKETAEIIGKDVNNVKVIQNRGLTKLKKAMGMDDDM